MDINARMHTEGVPAAAGILGAGEWSDHLVKQMRVRAHSREQIYYTD